MFAKQSLQVRLRGPMHCITARSSGDWLAARQELYQSLANDLKASFHTKTPPGAVLLDDSPADDIETVPPAECGDNFVMLVLEPCHVDMLWLKPEARRIMWECAASTADSVEVHVQP